MVLLLHPSQRQLDQEDLESLGLHRLFQNVQVKDAIKGRARLSLFVQIVRRVRQTQGKSQGLIRGRLRLLELFGNLLGNFVLVPVSRCRHRARSTHVHEDLTVVVVPALHNEPRLWLDFLRGPSGAMDSSAMPPLLHVLLPHDVEETLLCARLWPQLMLFQFDLFEHLDKGPDVFRNFRGVHLAAALLVKPHDLHELLGARSRGAGLIICLRHDDGATVCSTSFLFLLEGGRKKRDPMIDFLGVSVIDVSLPRNQNVKLTSITKSLSSLFFFRISPSTGRTSKPAKERSLRSAEWRQRRGRWVGERDWRNGVASRSSACLPSALNNLVRPSPSTPPTSHASYASSNNTKLLSWRRIAIAIAIAIANPSDRSKD